MLDRASTWDEVRRIADELELKIHLASMDARDRWRALQPRIAEIENKVSKMGKRVGRAIDDEVESISRALRSLRDDVEKPT